MFDQKTCAKSRSVGATPRFLRMSTNSAHKPTIDGFTRALFPEICRWAG